MAINSGTPDKKESIMCERAGWLDSPASHFGGLLFSSPNQTILLWGLE